MSNDLRELARVARPAGPPAHGFDTADSSGYVDLSAFSTSDAGWVDRELARARKGAPPPLPPPGVRAIDVLTPQSMAPVSLEAFGEPEDTMSVRPSRARGALYTAMGLAAVGAIGLLAFTLAKHPPPPQAQETTAAAVVAPPPAAVPVPPPEVTSAAATATPATALTSTPTTPTPVADTSTTTSKAKRKTFAASRAHAGTQVPATAPAPATAPTRAAAPAAVVIPKAKAAPGGDSLMDLIKKSVASGK